MTDRIAQAFRNPAALTDEDVADMVAAMRKDAAQANKRPNRIQNTGGTDDAELARQLAYSRRRSDLRKLKHAWG